MKIAPEKEVFVGIDQGTSSTKGAILNRFGDMLANFSHPAPQIAEDGNKVEQDAEGICGSVDSIISKCIGFASDNGLAVQAAGISVQRSGVLAWKRMNAQAVSPLITWADTRFQPELDKLGTTALKVSAKTGLPVLPNFAAPKISFLQKKFSPPVHEVTTLDSFLICKLTGGKSNSTEDSMAARTMLYSLASRNWDDDLTRIFSVDLRRLPSISPSISKFGFTSEIPIQCMLGDQQAALLGQMSESRQVLLNIGSIAALLVDTGDIPVIKPALKSSVFYSRKVATPPPGRDREMRFLTEVTEPDVGKLLSSLIEEKKYANSFEEVEELCARSLSEQSEGPIVFANGRRPLLPRWPDGLPIVMVGAEDAPPHHFVRGFLENVGNLILSMFEILEEADLIFKEGPRSLVVSGGASQSKYLIQYLADCLNAELVLLENKEASARGAALGALFGTYPEEDILSLNQGIRSGSVTPKLPSRRNSYIRWKKAQALIMTGRLPEAAKLL